MGKILKIMFACLLLLGCNTEGLMDSTDLDDLTTAKVYSDVEYTRKVLIDSYGRMRDVISTNQGSFGRFFNLANSCCMLDNATDDGAGNTTRTAGIVPGLQVFVTAGITAVTNPVAQTHPWTFYYRAIRSVNTFIANVDKSPLEEAEKVSSKNQARFLRAYYYHELFRWFGPLVITEEPLDPFAFNTTKRETLEHTVQFIVDEFDALSQEGVLPDAWDDVNYGRPTRGTALAYKARTLLYAASPLFEDSGVTWDQAAQAALDMINYSESGGWHELYYDATEPLRSYSRLFNERKNKEILLSYIRPYNNDLYNNFPAFNPWNVNKEETTCPTQWLVDSYDMADGSQPIVGYNSDFSPIINSASGYNDQNPYANRDPRLAQTILYHGLTWPKVNGTPATVDISTALKWGSGYFLTKWLDNRIDHITGGTTSMNFIMMRYAEVLLNYAEAVNESENSAAARDKAVVKLNKIRSRGGITNQLIGADYTQSSLRDRIRKERRVELCFEEHRFFDIRRWKIAKDVMIRPAMGITIVSGKFVRIQLDSRSYNERMDLMPIPNNETNNASLIFQTPGY
ncbi:MAG: RagB/SusD family nutrient uptake outer membrane protein [Bacteroidia bacterium]|nr:RagB/SusD family nutrient uptake outer membrane protein [Bacteroidia bacterium]